jgi:hypothetical protein
MVKSEDNSIILPAGSLTGIELKTIARTFMKSSVKANYT